MSVRKTTAKNKKAPAKKPGKYRSKAEVPASEDDTVMTKAKSLTGGHVKARPGVSRARRAARVVDKMMTAEEGGQPNQADLFYELEKLAKYIQDAKKKIASLRPNEVKEQFLPTASDELDAIIEATADATNAIMDATENIENVMEELDSAKSGRLMLATTAIYEACTFQDITGQRITRVVKTLQEIELKVDGLLKAFGCGPGNPKARTPKKKPVKKEITDEDLLNGPQDVGLAKSQAEIDALLAGFD